jgi:hypothetical protein
LIGGGESPLEVLVSKNNVFLVGVCVLYAEAEVCYGPRTRAVCPNALLFWDEDFSTFYVIGDQHDYARGSEIV